MSTCWPTIDDKTSIQALERKHPESPPRPHRNRRIAFEHKRHGVVNLIAASNVQTGEVAAECIDRNDSAAFIRFVRWLMKLYPKRKLYLVLDNGTTHRSKETEVFLRNTLVWFPFSRRPMRRGSTRSRSGSRC
ncbi:MAG: hypothetical protein FJX76_21305 [Armatimonadetes bacterium]|nr:hypothetical protein [Armatimonadota bacterium]